MEDNIQLHKLILSFSWLDRGEIYINPTHIVSPPNV
jgi:hypothetical protein